jgi:hypothetical protein
MSTFTDSSINARFPARYKDARSGFRFRVVDVTEDGAPDVLVTAEIGDGLLAAITRGRIAVTSSLIVEESRSAATKDGFLVAVPHCDVMVTTPVVGAGAVTGLEILMNMCEALFGMDESGSSPFDPDSLRRKLGLG